MKKDNSCTRNVFLAVGIVVAIVILILAFPLHPHQRHAEDKYFKLEYTKQLSPLVKKFFS